MSFSKDIQKWRKKVEKATLYVFRGTALDLFSTIIRRTPVRTGRLRGNWQTEINSVASGELASTSGAASLRKAKTKTGKAEINDSIIMVNNLPYAQTIEDGDYSKQAPQGMVKVTLTEFNDYVRKRATEAGKK